jgi:dihydrofolate synthase / folylpolyglutamate synthase
MKEKSDYQHAVNWLFQQFPSYQQLGAPAYKPGLDNTRTLLSLLGNPQENLNIIHVAGTNGKGSTSSYMTALLSETGKRVGLFTSPHIFDFRERIRVQGKQIPEGFVVDFCNQVQNFYLEFTPSFFEITLAMALSFFQQEKCHFVILETGMGGRLDATNVVIPLVSVITNIGYDHQQFLGETLPEIASEKAGIIKPNVPVVIGLKQAAIQSVFSKKAQSSSSPIFYAADMPLEEIELNGYQQVNWHTAMVTLKVLGFEFSINIQDKAFRNLTNHSGLFGRMERVKDEPCVLLDVSHNRDGLLETVKCLPTISGNWHVIIGASRDKNLKEMITVFPSDMILHLCEFSNERSTDSQSLIEIKEKENLSGKVFREVNEGLQFCLSVMSPKDGLLVIGSFFLISDVDLGLFN